MTDKKNYFFSSEDEIFRYLEAYPGKLEIIQKMETSSRQRLLDYMTGKKTLPFTYDPFFKLIFNPDKYPDRLSSFLSSILGKQTDVVDVLPVEHTMHGGKTVIIMDLLVRLDDGSRANVEIQKYAAGFPTERISCYSADALMQEYEATKARCKASDFDYRDVHKVYSIILYEHSSKEYFQVKEKGAYRHHGTTIFDTELNIEMLQEFFIINLDIFKDRDYTRENTVLNGWLHFLTTENMCDIAAITKEYPWLEEIYDSVADYMRDPKEAIAMYSKALQELDENSIRLFVDRLTQERDAAIKKLDSALKEKDSALTALKEKDDAIQKLQAQLDALKAQIPPEQ